MIPNSEIRKLSYKLVKKFSQIKAIIQFGSSVSGDFHKDISDVDLAVIIKSKKIENEIHNFFFKHYSSFELQLHIFSERYFIKNARNGEPLILSILYTGIPLCHKEYMVKLKKKNFKPNKSTARKCMLNSFAALGLAISDLTHSMQFDSVNFMYHAARSSIWATLINQEITPKNKRIFELIKDNKILSLYKKIIQFRENIPDYDADLSLDKKIYGDGNVNKFTNLLNDTITLIKINYKKIFRKEFIGFFELLNMLHMKYDKIPEFYTIMLSVDWKRRTPSYHTLLSFEDKERTFIEVNANNGEFKYIPLKGD